MITTLVIINFAILVGLICVLVGLISRVEKLENDKYKNRWR